MINTAQAGYFGANRRYGSLEELVLPAGSTTAPDFELVLLATSTGYAVRMTDKADPCRFAFFSDHTGVIYQGHPLK